MKPTALSPAFLVRNTYSYCFRLRVPADLQPYLCKKELRYSLRTGYLSEAKRKSRLLAGMAQELFVGLRKLLRMKISDDQIKKIASDHLQRLVTTYKAPDPPQDDDMAPLLAEAGRMNELQLLKLDRDELINDIREGNYLAAVQELPGILSEQGLSFSDITKDGESYTKLLLAIMHAKVQATKRQEAIVRGTGPSRDHDTVLDSAVDPVPDSSEVGKLISEVVPLFISENKIKWTPKTESEVQASLDLFIECIGDHPIQTVARSKIAEYKEILKRLPPNKNKSPKYRAKTIPELIKMKTSKTLSVERINKNLQRVGALFDYAIRHGIYEGVNPATQMQLPKDKWETAKRAPYTNTELERLLRSSQYLDDTFSKSYMFWTPIIALFHGMRQNEIAGLFLDDIQQSEDGVWYFDLFSRKSRPDAARRVAPIHPFLIDELRFLEYVSTMKGRGHTQLFPELSKTRDGYGKSVSAWFTKRYRPQCGIESKDGRMRDFHSFRTTFITRLRHKKVHDRMLKEVVGHSTHIDVTDTYTDPYPLKQLLDEVISKVTFHEEIDLTHLKDSKWVIK